jgi:hypothetical protein
LLLPIGYISQDKAKDTTTQTQDKEKDRKRPIPKPRKQKKKPTQELHYSSSEEDILLVTGHQTSTGLEEEQYTNQDDISEIGSASVVAEEIHSETSTVAEEVASVAEDTGVMEDSDEVDDDEDDEERQEELPRRSTRIRRQPNWLTTGEFVAKSTVAADREKRADFALKMLHSGVLQTSKEKSAQSLFQFILNSQ